MTTIAETQIVPREPASLPELRAADQGVASSLESVLASNTRRVYGTQWRIFTGWCDEVGLTFLPAQPLTVARYLAARAGSGAAIATIRLATSAISKAHEWAKLESPCRDPGVRASLKGWGRRLAKLQRQSGALTADVLAVMRLTAVQPRRRGRGIETPDQAAERGKFDVALVAVLSDAGLRWSEAATLTWGDVQRWDDGSGRITVIRSKTDAEATGAVVAITPSAMAGLSAIRPAEVDPGEKVFGLSESQIARRVKAIARAAGLENWEFLQRPQRPRGHGPAHGPERRAHPRDRTPGTLEAGRRNGRPLHPRRVRRVSIAVSLTTSSSTNLAHNGAHRTDMEFTVTDLALATNRSESYIRQRISQCDLVARREGRRLYVAQAEAARWARENGLTFVPTIPNPTPTEDVRDRTARVTVLVWQGQGKKLVNLFTHIRHRRRDSLGPWAGDPDGIWSSEIVVIDDMPEPAEIWFYRLDASLEHCQGLIDSILDQGILEVDGVVIEYSFGT